MIAAALFLFFSPVLTETADTIMARVAENQDRAEKARAAYVYRQNVLVRVKQANGKLVQEEERDYTIHPTETGIRRDLTHLNGKRMIHGKLEEYHQPKPAANGGVRISLSEEMDSDLCGDLAENFGSDEKSRDGVARDLFPLTGKEQVHYTFHLEGEDTYQGTPVYKIRFEPASKYGERPWEGEALIHRTEFQPVLVITRLSVKIPVAIKILLGTDIQHLGFRLNYAKFGDGVWFPTGYSGEMKVRALFFYARKIGISMRASDFQRADVNSTVTFAPWNLVL